MKREARWIYTDSWNSLGDRAQSTKRIWKKFLQRKGTLYPRTSEPHAGTRMFEESKTKKLKSNNVTRTLKHYELA